MTEAHPLIGRRVRTKTILDEDGEVNKYWSDIEGKVVKIVNKGDIDKNVPRERLFHVVPDNRNTIILCTATEFNVLVQPGDLS